MSLLEIKNLTVSYMQHAHHSVKALSGINLKIEKGETQGIVGESGCGKTTLALAITRLLPQNGRITKGEIIFEGIDILGMSGQELRSIRGGRISYVFQEPSTSLNPVLTVGSQLIEAIKLHTAKSQKPANAQRKYFNNRAHELLSLVGIKDPEIKLKSYPHQLSGGENQRVMIAMAISSSPSMLILDEPTSALDVTIQARLVTLFKSLKERLGLTIVLITHDLGLARRMCSKVNVMYQGSIVSDEHYYTKNLFNSVVRCPYL